MSLLLNGKLKKVGRSDLFSKKYIYGMNGENMVKKGEFPYNIEQEGNHGCLWNSHLNRSPGGTLMILSNIRNIDQSETFFFCNYSESGSMDKMLYKEFYF